MRSRIVRIELQAHSQSELNQMLIDADFNFGKIKKLLSTTAVSKLLPKKIAANDTISTFGFHGESLLVSPLTVFCTNVDVSNEIYQWE